MLIGKPCASQGKVLIVRSHVNAGVFLFDPAAPTALEPSQLGYLVNFACCGQSWDKDGDLVMSGGDKNSRCDPQEPLWTHIFYPEAWEAEPFIKVPNLLLPTPPVAQRYGYYYPSTVALHDGRPVSIGGSSAPWNVNQCGPEPPGQNANNWQLFNKAAPRWEGVNPGSPSDNPLPGVPSTGGWFYTFSIYPRVSLLTNGELFVSSQMYGGIMAAPLAWRSFSAFMDVTTWTPGVPPATTWTIHPHSLKDPVTQAPVNLMYGSAVQWPLRIDQSGLVPWDAGGWVDRTLVIAGYDDKPARLDLVAYDDPLRLAHKASGRWRGRRGSPSAPPPLGPTHPTTAP